MPEWKLTIFTNAYKTRLGNGEILEDIDSSYPKLSKEEITEIHKNLKEE